METTKRKVPVNIYASPTVEDWEDATYVDPAELHSSVRAGSYVYVEPKAKPPKKPKQVKFKPVEVEVPMTYAEFWSKLKQALAPHNILLNSSSKKAFAYRDYLGARLGVHIALEQHDLDRWRNELDKVLGQVVITIALQKNKWETELKDGNISKTKGGSPP